jgi:hypothetical protein
MKRLFMGPWVVVVFVGVFVTMLLWEAAANVGVGCN